MRGKKNAQHNITGLLVYHRGEFMQLLEGDREDILSVYHKVATDERHRQVNLLWNGPIRERSFAEWEMAFVGLDDLAPGKAAGYSRFLENEFSAQALGGSPSIGKDFLPDGDLVAATPSGTGYQASLFGLLGLTAARDEGIELTLLGLTIGIDVASPAIKLPGIGRIGLPRS